MLSWRVISGSGLWAPRARKSSSDWFMARISPREPPRDVWCSWPADRNHRAHHLHLAACQSHLMCGPTFLSTFFWLRHVFDICVCVHFGSWWHNFFMRFHCTKSVKRIWNLFEHFFVWSLNKKALFVTCIFAVAEMARIKIKTTSLTLASLLPSYRGYENLVYT